MENIKINEMVLEAINVEESYNLIKEVGSHTLNQIKHDEKLAIKAFYNVAGTIKDIINKELYENHTFARGERKQFAEALYNEFMGEQFN